jgi:hypothetical protein
MNDYGLEPKITRRIEEILSRDKSHLRDQFAMAAFRSMMERAIDDEHWQHGDDWMMQTCLSAYQWADAMLKAREVSGE